MMAFVLPFKTLLKTLQNDWVMSAFSKFIFKATTGFLSFADKYRLAYYTHLYGNQLELDNNIVFGRGSSITIFPGGKDSKIKLSRDNTFRRNCIITLDLGGQLIIGHSNFLTIGVR